MTPVTLLVVGVALAIAGMTLLHLARRRRGVPASPAATQADPYAEPGSLFRPHDPS